MIEVLYIENRGSYAKGDRKGQHMTESLDAALEQAGCPAVLRDSLVCLARDERPAEVLPQLAAFRLSLLKNLREADRRLICLDRANRAIQADENRSRTDSGR